MDDMLLTALLLMDHNGNVVLPASKEQEERAVDELLGFILAAPDVEAKKKKKKKQSEVKPQSEGLENAGQPTTEAGDAGKSSSSSFCLSYGVPDKDAEGTEDVAATVAQSEKKRQVALGDKRKRALECLDGFDAADLLALYQEKKKSEDDTKLAELAEQQGALKDEVSELERALMAPEAAKAIAQAEVQAAEAEIFRIRTELREKQGQLAEITGQMRSIGGAEDRWSGSGSML